MFSTEIHLPGREANSHDYDTSLQAVRANHYTYDTSIKAHNNQLTNPVPPTTAHAYILIS